MTKRIWIRTLVIVLFCTLRPAFAEDNYKKPPQAVLDVLNAPLPPDVLVNPTKDFAMLAISQRYPPIADVAAPMLRLAGARINPATNGLHRDQYVVSLTVKRI